MTDKAKQQAKLAEVVKALEGVKGVYVHDIRKHIDGNLSINKKAQLRIPVCLDAKEILEDPTDLRSLMEGNFKMIPLLVFVEAVDE